MYNYSPQTCLIKDVDGKIYNIIDLWQGKKIPVDLTTIQYSYAPKSCLVQNVDGTNVNVIDTILAVANGSGSGTSSLEEVIQARGKYSTLGERLDKENEKVYETINSKDFIPFTGENISVEHSKVGFTKDMQIEGMTYQNLHKKQIYNLYCDNVNNGKYIKINNENSVVVNITETLTSWYYFDCGVINVSMLKPNTKYTIVGDFKNVSSVLLQTGDGQIKITDGVAIRNNIAVLTTISDLTATKEIILYVNVKGVVGEAYAKNIMILEGDYTNSYIPSYFESIKSVGEKENKINILSNGKNLFKSSLDDFINGILDGDAMRIYYKLKPNTQYICISNIPKTNPAMIYFNGGRTDMSGVWNGKSATTTTDSNGNLYISLRNTNYPVGYSIEDFFNGKYYIQLEEGMQGTSYEPYKTDKKELKLPFEGGLKGLPNGAKDLIYNKDDGCYVRKNIERKILNGTENYKLRTGLTNTIAFTVTLSNKIISNNLLSNNFYAVEGIRGIDSEGLSYEGNGDLYIRVLKSKLETQDVAGFKKWLSQNPVEVYYELAEPIEHKITDLNSINLETFKDMTYVSSENEIQAKLSFKAPVDVQATISTLRENNAQLSNELEVKTQELQEKDKELANEDDLLTAKDLDMDFRIFELEEQLTPEIAKLSMSHNSPYPMIKRCIEKGLYEKEDMLYKMNRYLHGKRLTQEEYDELKSMMG